MSLHSFLAGILLKYILVCIDICGKQIKFAAQVMSCIVTSHFYSNAFHFNKSVRISSITEINSLFIRKKLCSYSHSLHTFTPGSCTVQPPLISWPLSSSTGASVVVMMDGQVPLFHFHHLDLSCWSDY